MITGYSNTISVTTLEALLLDTYSGAAAAYSLRLLRTAYTGSAIRVRRASDNAEQDIGFTNNELDTTTLASFCSGTNGFVTTWYDQSGNGNDATQTTASNQPKIYDSVSGVILENGKPCVDFDGSNDFLNLGDILSGESILNVFSIFNVERTGFEEIIVKGLGNVGEREYGLYGDEFLNVFDESNDTNVTVNTNISINNQYSVYWGYDTSNAFVGLNNGTNNTASMGSVVVQNTTSDLKFGTNVGNTSFALMTMQETIFYSSDQSSNRSGIETNINDFYSIY